MHCYLPREFHKHCGPSVWVTWLKLLRKQTNAGIARLKHDGTRAETRFRLSPKRTSPFKSAGASVQSTAGSRGVRISGSNAGYTTFRRSTGVLATHSIHQFPLHFLSHASPCAIRFQTHSTSIALFSESHWSSLTWHCALSRLVTSAYVV